MLGMMDEGMMIKDLIVIVVVKEWLGVDIGVVVLLDCIILLFEVLSVNFVFVLDLFVDIVCNLVFVDVEVVCLKN